jgi:hypothetical protein
MVTLINIQIPHIIIVTYKEAKHVDCLIKMRGHYQVMKNWQKGICSFITAKITVELECHSLQEGQVDFSFPFH